MCVRIQHCAGLTTTRTVMMSNASVFPGDELCDSGVDNNCTGYIDDDDPLVRSPLKCQDLDGDGYGNDT